MQWRTPPEFSRYLVTDTGETARLMTPAVNNLGYKTVSLADHTPRIVQVAWLVAETFHGPKPNGFVVAHRDNDRGNCSAPNVGYASRSEVLRRRYLNDYVAAAEPTGDWRTHPRMGRVIVCDDGRVARLLSPATVNGGYQRLSLLRDDGKVCSAYVHRLVLGAFARPPADQEVANHIDGNPGNNRVDNLEWVTQSENLTHKHRVLGKPAVGAKLTPEQVAAIRALPASVTHKEAGAMFGIHEMSAFKVRRGLSYRHSR